MFCHYTGLPNIQIKGNLPAINDEEIILKVEKFITNVVNLAFVPHIQQFRIISPNNLPISFFFLLI
ncbi:MAG: hypothetical protein JWR54_736 [Mucilaginibacter sp.]|jgi:hypothetical protein|nr:hypothetical protein [Mucilaginibacter sp.]